MSDKLQDIVNEYVEEYKDDELGFVVNLKKKIEQEMNENEDDDIYYDTLDEFLYELEEKLNDKGL